MRRDAAKPEGKPLRRGEILLLGAITGLALAFCLYVFAFEKDLGVNLLKALFGLSGGTTAGG